LEEVAKLERKNKLVSKGHVDHSLMETFKKDVGTEGLANNRALHTSESRSVRVKRTFKIEKLKNCTAERRSEKIETARSGGDVEREEWREVGLRGGKGIEK